MRRMSRPLASPATLLPEGGVGGEREAECPQYEDEDVSRHTDEVGLVLTLPATGEDRLGVADAELDVTAVLQEHSAGQAEEAAAR